MKGLTHNFIVQRRALFKAMVCSYSPDPESTKNPIHFKKVLTQDLMSASSTQNSGYGMGQDRP